ncbi:hypothetical protein L1987_71501 [Smallanthus sonchifolius]|uniref:Uncharacterized protein n=1 Tax=Smallanthus sonchifolius TaxID=185202 RepID=A0ACB9ATY5_9ASTR|nr:hypothetical protein L1987_71501 [Smallanthus sonchifolius]
MPDFKSSINLNHVKLAYQYLVNNILTLFLIPIIATVAVHLIHLGPDEIINILKSIQLDKIQTLCSIFFILLISTIYFMSKPRPVYLVDYTCYKAPVTCRVPFSTFMEHSRLILKDNPKSVEFQMRILERSGLGEETSLPPAIHYIPPNPNMESARGEAELVIFSAVDNLFAKTGLKPKDIDVLIVNCSLFSPTPSLSAMVVNKYKLRSNIKSYNLSGMGCSAGIIAIDLARDLLQVVPNSNVVVLAFEHFCIHAGGRAVIDELQKNLQLSAEHVEASRMTLHRFGNTSSSSLWYELSYIESKGRMKKGDRVWQIAFGSGFKCNSAVWKCNRNIKTPTDGPWEDCIDRYPVHIPEVVKL